MTPFLSKSYNIYTSSASQHQLPSNLHNCSNRWKKKKIGCKSSKRRTFVHIIRKPECISVLRCSQLTGNNPPPKWGQIGMAKQLRLDEVKITCWSLGLDLMSVTASTYQTCSQRIHAKKLYVAGGSLQTTRPTGCRYLGGLCERMISHHVVVNCIGWRCTSLHCLLQKTNQWHEYFHPCYIPVCLQNLKSK